jgi:hypothetical protein
MKNHGGNIKVFFSAMALIAGFCFKMPKQRRSEKNA